MDYLDPTTINGLNLYAYCGNDPINNKQKNISQDESEISSAISMGMCTAFTGESLGCVKNPLTPWWSTTIAGAIPDIVLGLKYLAAGVRIAAIGGAIGGVPGFIIGTVAGVVVGVIINGIFYTEINGKSIAGCIEDGIEGLLEWLF